MSSPVSGSPDALIVTPFAQILGSIDDAFLAHAAGSPPSIAAADASDFAQVLTANQSYLARLVQRLLGWPHRRDVDDVVQETLLRAWARRKSYRGDGTYRAWLTTIAIRCARNHQRSTWRRRRAEDPESDVDALAGPMDPDHRDDGAVLRQAVQKLPTRHREILVLRYLEGHSIPTIAGLLSVRRNTVDVRLSRARRALETVLHIALDGEPEVGP